MPAGKQSQSKVTLHKGGNKSTTIKQQPKQSMLQTSVDKNMAEDKVA